MVEHTRENRLAEDFESIATQLRDGSAELYGYDVEIEGDRTIESGGVVCAEGWLTFELDSQGRKTTQ